MDRVDRIEPLSGPALPKQPGPPCDRYRDISSPLTFIYKIVFPVAWLGLFGSMTLLTIDPTNLGWWFFVMAFLICGLFFWMYCLPLKKIGIEGDGLIVSNYIHSVRIPLNQIKAITENLLINTHPIWIEFLAPTVFGDRIMFMPPQSWNLFHSHPVVSELRSLIIQHREASDAVGSVRN